MPWKDYHSFPYDLYVMSECACADCNDSHKLGVKSCMKAKPILGKSRKYTSWYHFQASGLIGSPTVPRMRRDFREYFVTKLSPKDCSALMAVGAVYSSDTCESEAPVSFQTSSKLDWH